MLYYVMCSVQFAFLLYLCALVCADAFFSRYIRMTQMQPIDITKFFFKKKNALFASVTTFHSKQMHINYVTIREDAYVISRLK